MNDEHTQNKSKKKKKLVHKSLTRANLYKVLSCQFEICYAIPYTKTSRFSIEQQQKMDETLKL